MLKIGCHLSSSKGYEAMAKDAFSIHANTFQFFTRNPRGGKAKAINPTDIERYLAFAKIFTTNLLVISKPKFQITYNMYLLYFEQFPKQYPYYKHEQHYF